MQVSKLALYQSTMNNPTRRNRNIGTDKQGYRTQSKFRIPSSWHDSRTFYEKLGKTSTVIREINGQTITFIIEKTQKDCCHACTIEDIEKVLSYIPTAYFKGLTTIVLRQPKAKEAIFSPVWGRLIYLFEYQHKSEPALILECLNFTEKLVWDRSLSINAQKELTRLKEDGLEIEEDKRRYIFHPDINSVRNIQLYRTLLHEIGHFYQYISTEPEIYDKLTTAEKEAFAHHFAEQLKNELIGQKIIPFDRILTKEFIAELNLDISDFEINS